MKFGIQFQAFFWQGDYSRSLTVTFLIMRITGSGATNASRSSGPKKPASKGEVKTTAAFCQRCLQQVPLLSTSAAFMCAHLFLLFPSVHLLLCVTNAGTLVLRV